VRTAYVRFCDKLFGIIRTVIGVLLTASVLLNFANVIGRYVLRTPVIGAEEVMLYLMIAIVFLGFGAVAWEGRHIKMDILLDCFPPALQHAIRIVIELTAIAVAIVIIYVALPVVEQLATFNERSQAANVPMFIPQAFVPIGFALLIVGTIGRLLDPAQRLGRSDIKMLEDI
jgi:C4-dicarboxylate transporter DctQ subunit